MIRGENKNMIIVFKLGKKGLECMSLFVLYNLFNRLMFLENCNQFIILDYVYLF